MKTIKIFLLFVSFFVFSNTYGRIDSCSVNLQAEVLKKEGCFKKGSIVHFNQLKYMESISNPSIFLKDTNGHKYYLDKYIGDKLAFKYNNIQDLCDVSIISGVLLNLEKKGYQYELRNEMEEDALEYIAKVKEYNLEFYDPYLSDYIYTLLLKLVPDVYIDGRDYDVNILIQQSPEINACMFPNGTLVINTGLLSALHSEEELVAVLAHEVGHFVLDHSIINVNKAVARKKRAEFWSAVATGITAVAEGVATAKGNYYTPGLATLSVAALSAVISNQVLDHLGMKFNHEQEEEADRFAVEALKILGYDNNALATALSRIGKASSKRGLNAMYLESYTHPDLATRIDNVGVPQNINSAEYEQKISLAVTNVALMKYADRRFRQCSSMVSQNIKNNVANADDYILKVNCLLSTKNTDECNKEVISLITAAKNIEPSNINITKSEIIIAFRLNNIDVALDKLKLYEKSLTSIEHKTPYIINELVWVKNMIIKLRGMYKKTDTAA